GSGMAPLPVGSRAAPLTLAEAEARLLERNLAVLAARRGVDAARAQRLVASSLPPPVVSAGNTVAQFNQTSRGLQGARFLSPTNNFSVGLSVLIERGGKRTLRTRLAEEQIGVAEAQVLDALRIQLFQLRQGFLGALLARANLEVALANRASLDSTETLLRRQVRDGAIPEGDLLRFQASRIVFEADVPNNARAYAAGVAAVAALLDADPAAFQPGAGTPAALGLGRGRGMLSPVAFDLRGRFDAALPPLGLGREELGEAVASRADVVAATRQAGAAAANRALAEAARSRDVTLDTSWGRTRLQQDLPIAPNAQVNANNSFGLGVSIPIFTARIVEGNVGIAGAQQAQAELGARQALLGARAEFAAAWAGWEQARALLALYTGGALARAEEAYRSTEQAYAAGGRSLIDVLDALRTLNQTRLGANQARYAALLALAALEQATGVSGIAPRL
ncbi:MAG: TolC family protein, partial [Acetobacteraceae bacterium]|nr:TolC family protein [Acetobacteraceae bacterium]